MILNAVSLSSMLFGNSNKESIEKTKKVVSKYLEEHGMGQDEKSSDSIIYSK